MSLLNSQIFSAGAVELLADVWFELTLASLAAVIYFAVAGRLIAPKAKSKINATKNPKCLQMKRVAAKHTTSPELQSATKALGQGKINETIAIVQQLPETVAGHVPVEIASRLLTYVAKTNLPDIVLIQLKVLAGKIDSVSLEFALKDVMKQMDTKACKHLHKLAEVLMIPKTECIFEALARAYSSDTASLHKLLNEAGTPLKKSFAKAVLEACALSKDVELASEVFERIQSCDAAALRKVVENAASAASNSESAGSHRDAVSQSRIIRSFAKTKDLEGAVEMFERLRKTSACTLLYNSILDTCIECGDVDKAIQYFIQAKDHGMADVVSHNTLIKGHLSQGNEDAARHALKEITQRGLLVTHLSYHGLLNARVQTKDRRGAWLLVDEMRANGVVPNAVTCSILLKGTIATSAAEVSRVLSLVDAMEDPVDEVLFSSVAEACIRARRLDILARQFDKYASQGTPLALAAPTYGSMIKAYGQARDVKRARGLWDVMIKQEVKPTAVTLGCMVEALVINICTLDAWQLVQRMWNDESTRPLVNTVIYSTILKGFANAKDLKKVMELYGEMKSRGVQPNTITFNTILNAYAQSGAMNRVPKLLEDMKVIKPPVEWDIVTYSTIIKGFCSSGNLDRGLEILREMKADAKCLPDEVMYNSLLDGCAKEHRLEDALVLLEDMKSSGVAPSNYTLSMLVKLMGRCRRLGQAFSLVEALSQDYGVKVNIQVYTCLIQACFNNRQVGKALNVHDKILKEGLCPDETIYTVLVRGCLHAGATDKALKMARHAYLVADNCTSLKVAGAPGLDSRCFNELLDKLGGAGSKAGQAFLEEVNASKEKAWRSRRIEASSKGGLDSRKSTPWRQQRRVASSSTSTQSGSSTSCSESD